MHSSNYQKMSCYVATNYTDGSTKMLSPFKTKIMTNVKFWYELLKLTQ